VPDDKTSLPKLADQELVDDLTRFCPIGVNAEDVGKVLGKPSWAVERPATVLALVLGITEHHAAEFNKLFFGEVLGEVGIWHRELVTRDIAHLQCAVEDVGVLRRPEDVDAIWATSAGQEKQVSNRDVAIAGDDSQLGGAALSQDTESGSELCD
jgi:hypothetical protein